MLLIELPVVRTARRDRVPLRRPGARRLPRGPRRPHRRGVGAVPLLPRQPQGPVRRALGAQRRVPPLVQRRARHPTYEVLAVYTADEPRPDADLITRGRRSRRPPMSTQTNRLPSGGRIDRGTELRFTVDGVELTGHPGDTIASALLANGLVEVAPSIYRGRPRGIVAAGVEEPNALVQILGAVLRACCPRRPLAARRPVRHDAVRAGPPRPDARPRRLRQDVRAHRRAGRRRRPGRARRRRRRPRGSGARVILLDEQSELGGSLLAEPHRAVDGSAALEWVAEVGRDARRRRRGHGAHPHHGLRLLRRQLRARRRAPHRPPRRAPQPDGVSRQRVWHIRARQVVLATGAHERPLVFAGNDRPRRDARRRRAHLPQPVRRGARSRAVVATTNDSAYDTGRRPASPPASRSPPSWTPAPTLSDRAAEVAVATGCAGAAGHAVAGRRRRDGRLDAGPRPAPIAEAAPSRPPESLDCDLLAVSGGWSPVVHLHSQRQGRLRWDEELAAFVPDGTVEDQQVVGAGRGTFGLDGCLAEGARAGARAATAAGFPVERRRAATRRGPPGRRGRAQLWLVPAAEGEPGSGTRTSSTSSATRRVADVWRSTGAGMRSVEHVKRYTSIGTGQRPGQDVRRQRDRRHRRGARRLDVGEIGTTTYRAPYTPVAFAALAGRERGELFDPERTTPIHGWHVAHGAEFEDVGQWLRPWYYPQDRRGHGRGRGPRVPRGPRGRRRSWTPPRSARSRSGAPTRASSSTGSTPTPSRSWRSARPATA